MGVTMPPKSQHASYLSFSDSEVQLFLWLWLWQLDVEMSISSERLNPQ